MPSVSKPHSSRDHALKVANEIVAEKDGYAAGDWRLDMASTLLDLEEQLEAERRQEWREGIVNVLDHEGNYLGCMGSETWAWTLDGGIKRMKEQLEASQKALRDLWDWVGSEQRFSPLEVEREVVAALASNPASERCPVCEGLDQPGLLHNPRAPYCSQAQNQDTEPS